MHKSIIVMIAILCAAIALTGCVSTERIQKQDDTAMNWWPSKAVPQPKTVEDKEGAYWWPTHPGEETERIWGNQGYVYVVRHDGGEIEDGPVELPVAVKPVEEMKLRDVHFHYDSAELTPAAETLLADAVVILKEHPEINIVLEGHTCSCGPESYNINLGQARADAIMRFLVLNGIDQSRIQATSYGEMRPMIETQDVRRCIELPQDSQIRREHSMNRRVEFRLE